MFIDGVSKGNPGEAACAGVLYQEGEVRGQFSYFLGVTTNNVAEYFGFILGLVEAIRLGYKRVCIYTDSQLLVKQIQGDYQVKDEWLRRLHLIA
ncbi:MAG: ribonuclease HI family protein, partial [Candidatus Omnitrophica bacterium]|nr:ribonuclease HI family protein [Candidatus Omnitrophota bacterium]